MFGTQSFPKHNICLDERLAFQSIEDTLVSRKVGYFNNIFIEMIFEYCKISGFHAP